MAQTDRDALVVLYRATGGENWRERQNWDTDADLKTWHGVDVNDQGRVVKLKLRDNNLEGEIPATLGKLGNLQQLHLSWNKLSGRWFQGHIPKELGDLSQLQALELYRNQLTGPIPEELGALSNLLWLSLYSNQLTGEIPATLGQLGNLEKLNLSWNRLSGPIPDVLGAHSNLRELLLSSNQLTDEIPATLGQLGNLQQLDLSWNKLSAGYIPQELGGLSQLRTLWLYFNQLTGPIPEALGTLSNLRELSLYSNRLTDEIPATLGQLGNLQQLRLSWNKLSGHIPQELGSLSQLRTLGLHHNQLTGPIFEALGDLSELEFLVLNDNQLTGLIPKELGNLRGLERLYLHNNQQSGPIPLEVQKLPRFGKFITGIALNGPPLPAVRDPLHAFKILIVPVVLGYADLASDLYTAVSYYEARHFVWFGLGLVFALGPAVIMSSFCLSGIGWFRRFLVAAQLSLLAEALITLTKADYSPVLALVRVIEPLFESVPQLLLQLHAMLWLWTETSFTSSRLAWRVVSVCISAASLAYAATDVSSVERLLTCDGGKDGERFRLCPCFPSLTELVFSRVPAQGTSSLRGLGNVHPRSHVWLCLVYHVLEIVARFVPLAMLVLVVRGWFFFVLVYLWVSRALIVWMTAREVLGFRFWVRLVAMPFLDSIMDETTAFGIGLGLTLVEFIVCMVIFHVYKHDDLPSRARLVLVTVASCCMVGKMCLALVAISPLKVDGSYSESQGDGVLGDGRGSAVTDGSVADVEMSAIEDSKVDGGVEASVVSEPASPKGADGPSVTSALSTGSVVRGPGDVKLEDETDGADADELEEGSELMRMEDGKIEDGSKAAGGSEVSPPEGTHLPPATPLPLATHPLSTISTVGGSDAKVKYDS
ncbi:unnamed protein product [Ectocarpus sp. 6 AP-2014]